MKSYLNFIGFTGWVAIWFRFSGILVGVTILYSCTDFLIDIIKEHNEIGIMFLPTLVIFICFAIFIIIGSLLKHKEDS
jgi:hypothetical protein